MATQTRAAETYLPGEDREGLAEVYSFLAAHQSRFGERPRTECLLVGDQEGERVELPRAVYELLLTAVESLAAGRAVTITPQEPQLTTQQAADLLGVSRPTVVRLIESGELAADVVGSRRRLLLSDVMAYRDVRRRRQYAMLEATAVDLDTEDDPQAIIARLRRARKAVADQEDRRA